METILQAVGINFSYMKNREFRNSSYEDLKDLPPRLLALHWAMSTTTVFRLFSKNDLFELITRLNILFKINKPIDNWFTSDYLFKYNIGEKIFEFTSEDLFDFIGIEILNSTSNYSKREDFLDSLDAAFKNSFWESVLGGNPVVVFKPNVVEREVEEIVQFNVKDHLPTISKKDIEHSEFLAHDILSKAPKNLFEGTEKLFEERINNIENRKALINAAPKFKFEEVPKEIVDQCVQIMYEGSDFVDNFLDRKEGIEEGIDFMIETAWAYANDFFIVDQHGMYSPVEALAHYDFDRMNDLADFRGLEGFMSNWNIKDTVPLLKGLFISNKFKEMMKRY